MKPVDQWTDADWMQWLRDAKKGDAYPGGSLDLMYGALAREFMRLERRIELITEVLLFELTDEVPPEGSAEYRKMLRDKLIKSDENPPHSERSA